MTKLTHILAAGLLSAAAVQAAQVRVKPSAIMELDKPACAFAPECFNKSWEHVGPAGFKTQNDKGEYPFKLNVDGVAINGYGSFSEANGIINAKYVFVPEKAVEVQCLFVGVRLPLDVFADGTWQGEGKDVKKFPGLGEKAKMLGYGWGKSLVLTGKDGQAKLELGSANGISYMLQDNRTYNGQDFSVRLGLLKQTKLEAKQEYAVEFTLKLAGAPLKLLCDKPVKITAGDTWLPLKADLDIIPGSALDFSGFAFQDAPAGKYGYTVPKGEHFEFEKKPGVEQRFYGVNICFSANYLDDETAEKTVRRLAMIGYNSLRLHHHDGGLVEGSADGTTINPAKLAMMDKLVAECIKRGIYITTDFYVSRSVPWRSVGIEKDGRIPMDIYKVLAVVHEGTFDNLKTFIRQWMTHVNPHTGRAYAQEPAISLISAINEGNLGNRWNNARELPQLQDAWKKWLSEQKAKNAEAYKDVPETLPHNLWGQDRHTRAFVLFLREADAKFMVRMKEFVSKELKCKALLTNMNGWTHFSADQVTREDVYDYVDDHFYVDHPEFLDHQWTLPSKCANVNPVQGRNMGAQQVVFQRTFKNPFTITEYNFSAPGQFRGVGGIITGALGALQEWAGIWRFAYSHNDKTLQGNQAVQMHYFDTAGDPLSMAAERASLCLFIRKDLAPLKPVMAFNLPKREVLDVTSDYPLRSPPAAWLSWYAKVGTATADKPDTKGITWSKTYKELQPNVFTQADVEKLQPKPVLGGGALSMNQESGTFIIKTARTCGGFTEKGVIAAEALTFDADSPATIWASSLSAEPIATAKRLLLTHLTDVQNSNIEYADESLKVLLKWGGLPHLMRKGKADIRLKLKTPGAYKVYALDSVGKRVQPIQAAARNGELCFTARVDAVPGTATMLYEIIKE